MGKSAVRIICFFLATGAVLGYLNKVFKFKYSDGIYAVTTFYKLENNTVDVLFLGSSHAFISFNGGTLWDEYGIASYALGGSVQPMWTTYYYLKEALKTQTPELIVLEGYMLMWDSDYRPVDGETIKNTFGLRWSREKIDAVKASAPREKWTGFLLEYTQYHTRYTELSDADFLKNQNSRYYDDWKGFAMLMNTEPVEPPDVSGVAERAELYEKTERYYRATIELAQMNNIPIMVVISPYAGISEYEQQKFNTGGDIAVEYGVPFLNCNLLYAEIGIDYSTDAADTAHLNPKGSQKYSSFFGSYLVSNFDLSDRRGDAAYDSWQRNAAYVTQMSKDLNLKETYDIEEIAEKLQDDNYWLFLTVDGNCTTSDENLRGFFNALGLPADGSRGVGLHNAAGWEWYPQAEEVERYIRVAHDFCIRKTANDDGTYTNSIIIDNSKYQRVTSGVNIVVYDTLTEQVADTMGIDPNNGYIIIK